MNNAEIFEASECPTADKLANFPKYVRRQNIARFLAQHEMFKRQLRIKGSIVECGVHHGSGVMTWAHLSAIYEPYNYHRKVIGFDTFEGFPEVEDIDGSAEHARPGAFSVGYDSEAELLQCVEYFDENRFLNNRDKIELVRGDANETMPKYLEENQHLLVSLLFIDFDIYRPAVTAIQTFYPRVPKGGIVAFDEVNNPQWPGETVALMEELGLDRAQLEIFEYEPNISFFVKG